MSSSVICSDKILTPSARIADAVARRIHVAETVSTNALVRTLVAQGEELPDITLVDAECQTAGRGQRGNSWEAAAGQNLTFSLVLRPEFVTASRQFVLSQAMALAVADVTGGLVKWPNDIYIGERKVSGTLIECDLTGHSISTCIIGTGVNVNQRVFLSDAPNPVSLATVAGHDLDRETVLADILEHFGETYELLRRQPAMAEAVRHRYRERLFRGTGHHAYEDCTGRFEAEVADVEPTGHIVLRDIAGRLRRYAFKEIRFLL